MGIVKIFGGGYTFLVFGIFINKFCKNFGGMVHFYPPSPPAPSPCVHLWITSTFPERKVSKYKKNISIENIIKHLNVQIWRE
jgi:hypothetical protein